MNYNEFFNDLAANSSRLYKEAKLEENKDDILLREIIFTALDSFTQFYIRKIPEYTSNGNLGLNWAIGGLKALSLREVTGHAGINHLKWILENIIDDDAKVIERIIAKDLKCGVSVATVNKIWPGLISEFPVMLASSSDPKLLANMQWPALAELKMDGMRFNAIVREIEVDNEYRETVELRARSGKHIDLGGFLEEEFLQASRHIGGNISDLVFDGELWVADENGNPLPRKVGNGILNKAIKGTISKEEAAKIHCTVWDVIDYYSWKNGHYSMPLMNRRSHLRDLIMTHNLPKFKKIQMIEYDTVKDFEEANLLFQNYLEKGEEGIILKNPQSPWEAKRSKHHIKFKAEKSADLLCIGWEEGTGKNIGRIGALNLQTSDGLIKVSVGTGFSDDDRLKDPSFYLDSIIEITYNERIKSKEDKEESLFLPVFISRREDKTTANSSKELK